ncbi:MAG TPA: carboxylesterase family protein [Mucilaginibacter sp.]|nr:carboxylesterase family protein [Mucilaginibacter sp.]
MKKNYSLALAAAALCAIVVFFAFKPGRSSAALPEVIRIDDGSVSGVKDQSGEITSWKGIPFAAPPVGNLRWKAPQAVPNWDGVKKCDAFGPSPMQGKPVPFGVYTKEFLIPDEPISEDCLYLNVWAKNNAPEKKPVFVWIYGGGFVSGGAGVPIYDGEAMARKGVVFVSVNYRVGIFGFLAHPELTKESPEHASGNYALLDQIAALKWVKRNIAKFGGDPQNVTIAGQSAGSMSVNCLVASPAAKGLFKKAIAESGSLMVANPTIKTKTLQEAEEQGVKTAIAVGAKSLAELRKVPAEQLLKAGGGYSPIVDGYVLPEPVWKIFAGHRENDVPLMAGWNADEGFVTTFQKKEEFVKMAHSRYGDKAEEFLKYFPAGTDAEADRSQVKLSRDMIFAMSGYKWAGIQSGRNVPVYVYYFEHKLPATPEFEKYGAFHTGEVAYVMDNLKFLYRPWKDTDHTLADAMSAYWVNFIKSGNPNGKGLPEWPEYNADQSRVMVFGDKPVAGPLPDKGELNFMIRQVEGK